MKTTQIVLLAALVGASSLASAAYDGTRDDRMQSALDNYHRAHPGGNNGNARYGDSRNPSPGPAARAESSAKRIASNTGEAIKHGATKAGHAIASGARKAGHAVGNAGRKVTGKTGE